MQMQPSPQGIASLYMGNPGALQKKVQKEQQTKPEMPPDLKKLLALNIVTTVDDAAKRQQAMNALNQMAPNGQQPPTVAESLQEQAKQKIQARMLQEQRQQQGLAALAQGNPSMGVPEGTQFAQQQPQQGIDELPVEMEFAGGGIVAFKDGDYVEPSEKELEEQRQRDAAKLRAVREFLGENLGDAAAKAVAAGADIATIIPRGLAGAVDTALIRPARALGANVGYLSPALTPGNQRPDTATPFYDRYIRAREEKQAKEAEAAKPENQPNKTSATQDRVGPMTAPKFVDPRIVQVAPEKAKTVTQRPPAPARAPGIAGSPLVNQLDNSQAAATGPDATYLANLDRQMKLDPAARAAEIVKRQQEMVGAPDTSQYDRLIAELEGRRKQFEAPAQGFDAFMEYMGQIAAQGPQRTSGEAGAKGALAQQALEKQRQTQQFDLTKQMVDVAQKKLDTERGYKRELFTLSEQERDQIDKQVQDATKEYGLNYRDAQRYKRDLEMKALEFKNQKELERIKAGYQASNRPFNVIETQYNLLKTTDPKKNAELLQKLVADNAAGKKPGLDMENLKKFESLPGVKSDLEMLNIYQMKKDPKPADVAKVQEIQARLVAKARANGIDPEQIGLTGGQTGESNRPKAVPFDQLPK